MSTATDKKKKTKAESIIENAIEFFIHFDDESWFQAPRLTKSVKNSLQVHSDAGMLETEPVEGTQKLQYRLTESGKRFWELLQRLRSVPKQHWKLEVFAKFFELESSDQSDDVEAFDFVRDQRIDGAMEQLQIHIDDSVGRWGKSINHNVAEAFKLLFGKYASVTKTSTISESEWQSVFEAVTDLASYFEFNGRMDDVERVLQMSRSLLKNRNEADSRAIDWITTQQLYYKTLLLVKTRKNDFEAIKKLLSSRLLSWFKDNWYGTESFPKRLKEFLAGREGNEIETFEELIRLTSSGLSPQEKFKAKQHTLNIQSFHRRLEGFRRHLRQRVSDSLDQICKHVRENKTSEISEPHWREFQTAIDATFNFLERLGFIDDLESSFCCDPAKVGELLGHDDLHKERSRHVYAVMLSLTRQKKFRELREWVSNIRWDAIAFQAESDLSKRGIYWTEYQLYEASPEQLEAEKEWLDQVDSEVLDVPDVWESANGLWHLKLAIDLRNDNCESSHGFSAVSINQFVIQISNCGSEAKSFAKEIERYTKANKIPMVPMPPGNNRNQLRQDTMPESMKKILKNYSRHFSNI